VRNRCYMCHCSVLYRCTVYQLMFRLITGIKTTFTVYNSEFKHWRTLGCSYYSGAIPIKRRKLFRFPIKKSNKFQISSVLYTSCKEQARDAEQWRTERGVWGVQTPPPPKFRSFDKVEPDCKSRGKCLVFLFQHPN
jgi:hypothetical protein